MEIFYSDHIEGKSLALSAEDSIHCARVLRHRTGEKINVIDGEGTLLECEIIDANPKAVRCAVLGQTADWHSHPYNLTMAVCPTKNNERFEWFVEKAVEIGVDRLCPVIGERSERKVYKTDRARKIVLSATKQSLKACLAQVCEPTSVKQFIQAADAEYKFIAYCFEENEAPRRSFATCLTSLLTDCKPNNIPSIAILIGPEGDFSPEEAREALAKGFVPIHLGASRLRTETAALQAVAQVYATLAQ